MEQFNTNVRYQKLALVFLTECVVFWIFCDLWAAVVQLPYQLLWITTTDSEDNRLEYSEFENDVQNTTRIKVLVLFMTG